MASPLFMLARVRDELVAHCHQAYPKEACVLLASSTTNGTIIQVYPMRNVEESPIGYRMNPKEQLQVEQQMRRRGQRLAAIYHSHTASAAYPSPVDVRLALSPEVSYVLISLIDPSRPVVKSYRIDGQRIDEEPVIQGMASRIWEPAEDVARKLIRFGEIHLTAAVHQGQIRAITIDLGPSKIRWTLEEVEQGKVGLSLIE